MKRALAEMERQRQQESRWGKWVSRAKVAAKVGAIAASVGAAAATGGSSLAIAAALLAASHGAKPTMDALGANPEIELAGIRVELSTLVQISCAVAGGGAGATGQTGTWAQLGRGVEIGGHGLQTAAKGTEAVATLKRGQHQARADTAEIDADRQAFEGQQVAAESHQEMELLRAAAEVRRRAFEILAEVQEQSHQVQRSLMGISG